MNKYLKVLLNPLLLPIVFIIFIIFLVLLICTSTNNDMAVVSSQLSKPFSDEVKYTITSSFGGRDSPVGAGNEVHTGIDISLPQGTEILAPADGYVVSYKVTVGTGESVILEHNIDGIAYRTVYYHMLEHSVVVSEGQKVSAKQKIGVVGMSGTQVTGVHLHFEVRTFNNDKSKFEPIDPSYIFDK